MEQQPKRLSRKELIRRNKKVAKRRQNALIVIAVAIAAFLVYITGLYGASLAYFGDFLSSGMVYLQFGNGFPVEVSLSTFKQAEKMGSSLCVLDANSLTFYSPTADKGFEYYHSMQKPIIQTSDNRLVVYNANETSLKVANAHKVLFSQEMKNDIIHVAIGKNNFLAVTTKSQSYNGEVKVFDAQMNEKLTWLSAKSFPLQSYLSPKGKTLLVSTVLTVDGKLCSDLYAIDVVQGTEKFVLRTEEEIPLGIEYIKEDQAVLFFKTKTQLVSLSDGSIQKEYSHNKQELLSYDMKNGQIALALGNYNQTIDGKLVLLDISLNEIATVNTGQNIQDVALASQRVYVLGEENVQEFDLKGKMLQETMAQNNNKKILDYFGGILISSTKMEKMEKTNIK